MPSSPVALSLSINDRTTWPLNTCTCKQTNKALLARQQEVLPQQELGPAHAHLRHNPFQRPSTKLAVSCLAPFIGDESAALSVGRSLLALHQVPAGNACTSTTHGHTELWQAAVASHYSHANLHVKRCKHSSHPQHSWQVQLAAALCVFDCRRSPRLDTGRSSAPPAPMQELPSCLPNPHECATTAATV